MSKSKAIAIKILGPDGKWKTLKTDSVTEGIKKLKKTVRQNSKDSSQVTAAIFRLPWNASAA